MDQMKGFVFASAIRKDLLGRWHEGYFVVALAETSEPIAETQCVWTYETDAAGFAVMKFGRDMVLAIPPGPTGRIIMYVADIDHTPITMLNQNHHLLGYGTTINLECEEKRA